MFFFKNHAVNEAGRLVPDLFVGFTIFQQPSNQHTIKTNCIKLLFIDPGI